MFTSVIIPSYNEVERIENTLGGLKDIKEIDEIIVIDDGSTDGTVEKVSKYDKDKRVRFFAQERNMGKGKALERGLIELDKKSEIVVFLDADLGETSSEVIKIINPVASGEYDVAIAKFKPAKKKGGMGFVKRLAKDSVYEITGKSLDSTISGQRAFKREVIDRFDSIPDGYGVEVGMTIDIINWGYSVTEVLVDMRHNETGRDLKGFIHRGKQYYHIRKIAAQKRREWK